MMVIMMIMLILVTPSTFSWWLSLSLLDTSQAGHKHLTYTYLFQAHTH